MEMNSLLESASKSMGIDLNQDMVEEFSKYKAMLKEWNEKINITSITEDDEIDLKHFADSLSILKSGKFNGNKKVIDVGTGGGFPGLPLKIYNKDLDVTLLDSLNKRIIFLNEVIEELKMDRITPLHGRAEELGIKSEFREQFDVCVSRAVASLDTLSEYCIPFVKVGGYFISMKGPQVEEEVNLSSKAIEVLGCKVEDVIYVTLPGTDITHSLIVIKKERNTPKKYPRGGGKPKKTPIK